jgi:hypothetical protein
MKTFPSKLLLAGLIIFGCVVLIWLSFNAKAKSEQANWPGKQLRNAVTLGNALSTYHKNRGTYPTRLEDLVTEQILTSEQFKSLRFRSAPSAAPEPWHYEQPGHLTDIAIIAPSAIMPWSGHSGDIIIARPDGSGKAISATKTHLTPLKKLQSPDLTSPISPPSVLAPTKN